MGINLFVKIFAAPIGKSFTLHKTVAMSKLCWVRGNWKLLYSMSLLKGNIVSAFVV